METASVNNIQEKLEEQAIEHVDNRVDSAILATTELPLRQVINPFLLFSLMVFSASTLLFGFDNNVVGPIAALEPFVRKYQGVNHATGSYVFTARNQDLIFSVPLVGTIFGAWSDRLFNRNLMAISPLYLSEVVPAIMRGRSVSSQNIFTIVSGVIATVVVNATSKLDGKNSYMIPLVVQCALPIILIPFTALLPKSPIWLAANDRLEDARKSLRKLRAYSDEMVDNELELIKETERAERELGQGAKFWELKFYRGNIKRTLTVSSLFSMNQVSGIILSTTYATIFLEQIGVANPFGLTIAAACCQLAGAIIGPFLVDSAAVRTGIAILSFIFNVIWTGSFNALSMLIPSEVATITSAGAGNLRSKAYLVFGGCTVFVIIFTFFMIPETKGLTFTQIDEMYERGVPAWRLNSELEGCC
ncbi:hypothetical protein V1515DRAFT_618163 [Lipomyces mesembrius]